MIKNKNNLSYCDYWTSFFIMAAFVMSNLFDREFPVHILFSLISFFIIVVKMRSIDIRDSIFLVYIYVVSTAFSLDSASYWITLMYKTMTFFPVLILVRRYNMSSIILGVYHAVLVSIFLAIILILLGLSHHMYIIYFDGNAGFAGTRTLFPRFAAMAIEPVSLAAAILALALIANLGKIKFAFFNKIVLGISSIMSLSTFNLFLAYVVYDMAFRRNVKLILYPVLLFFLTYVLLNTRFIDSISMRLFLYSEIVFKKVEFGFWGMGLYGLEEAAGLPGLLRLWIECGAIFTITIILIIFFRIIKHRKHSVLILVGCALPFLTEAYGSPILWLVTFLYLKRTKKCVE